MLANCGSVSNMGLFNWIFKGVKVENRTPKTKAAESVISLPDSVTVSPALASALGNNPNSAFATVTNESVIPVPPVSESARNAASILFERSENTLFNSGYSGSSQQYSSPNAQNFSSALNGATYGNRNILVVTPRTNVEVTQVVSNLQNGDACIVCLEGLDSTDAQRRLDFLSGVICAMNGSIKRLNPNTYILTPNGIGVRN